LSGIFVANGKKRKKQKAKNKQKKSVKHTHSPHRRLRKTVDRSFWRIKKNT